MQAICALETQSPISDSIITVAIFLAQDEVSYLDCVLGCVHLWSVEKWQILLGNIPWVQQHLQGAIQMVKHNGALKEKGHNVFLYDIIRNDIANSEIIRSAAPFPQL